MPQTRHLALALACAALAGTGVGVALTDPGSAPAAAAAASVVSAVAASSPAVSTVPRPSQSQAVVAVSVAQVWSGHRKVRAFDRPALQRPAHVLAWLRAMTFGQRSHLYRRLATQVRYGEQVVVLGTRGSLSRVRVPDQTGGRFPDGIIGWVASAQLAPQPADWPATGRFATVTADRATLHRSIAGETREMTISYATMLPVLHTTARRVVVDVPGVAKVGWLARDTVRVHRAGAPAIHPSAHQVLAQARRFLGLPYLWAGMTAWGYDCSGLVSTVYSQLGIRLPRDAADQSLVGPAVSRHDLRVGDLVFFSHTRHRGDIHHVAIYAGRGRVLQSPYTGARVGVVKLRHSYLNREYWGASRPLSGTAAGT